MNIKVLEAIKIRSTMSLSSDDLSVLALLYQPLISANAFTLYITLSSLLNKEKNFLLPRKNCWKNASHLLK